MRRIMVLALLLFALIPPAGASPYQLDYAADKPVRRVAGATRILTAVEVSKAYFDLKPETATALVATAGAFPDALAAGALAAQRDAPLLLTSTDSLPDDVATELTRLATEEVIVLGGTAAVSPAVAQQIAALPHSPDVTRLRGENRFETAAVVAEAAGAASGQVTFASGGVFPDALSAAALAASPDGLPVLLVGDNVPSYTAEAVSTLEASRGFAIGGPAVISDAVLGALQRLVPDTGRLSGATRYETSQAVVSEALKRFDGTPRPLIVATGGNYPDALSAGAAAAKLQAPVLLVPGDQLSSSVDSYIRANRARFSEAIVIGGTAAVSNTVLEQIDDAINGRTPPPEPEPEPPPAQFGDGTYVVPDEVRPGLYRNSDSSASCYWERLSGFSGEIDDIIANGISDEIFIVEIADTDAGFSSNRCGTWSSDLSPRTASPTAGFSGGHYRVGSEVAPGTWRNSDSGDTCYWERLSGFSGTFDDIISNGLSDNIETVTISADDVGFWSTRCGTWTKIG